MLYATVTGNIGSLVDYSGRRTHTKHSTISVNPAMCVEYQIPQGYRTRGVSISSTILQRILREYKNSWGEVGKKHTRPRHSVSKRVILTGNSSYIHNHNGGFWRNLWCDPIASDDTPRIPRPLNGVLASRFSLNRSDRLDSSKKRTQAAIMWWMETRLLGSPEREEGGQRLFVSP